MLHLEASSPVPGGADIGFRLASLINGQPMAMRDAELTTLIEAIAANRFVLPRNRASAARITERGTAIVEVHGFLLDRSPFLGTTGYMTAYEGLTEQCRRLRTNADVQRIVLDIDSPGGMVAGIHGCAEAIRQLADAKPVHAIAHNLAASGGYWLACAARHLSVTPDGRVGSIGVIAQYINYAERLDREGIAVRTLRAGLTKADMSSALPYDVGAAAERQADIDRAYDQFCTHVARARRMTVDAVRSTEARTFVGDRAVAAGLADRIETLEALVERIEAGAKKTRKSTKKLPDSKAGLAPLERAPAEPDTDDDPTARHATTQGPIAMSMDALRAQIAQAIDDILEPVAAAPAAAPARAAATPTLAAVDDAAVQARVDAAVSAALDRVFAVMTCEAAATRPRLALELAKSGLPVAAASAILAAAAVEAAPTAAEPAADRALDNALVREMAKPGNAAAVKPEATGAAARPSLAEQMRARTKPAVKLV